MAIQPINWIYCENKHRWIGTTGGLFSHIHVHVIPLHSTFEECIVEFSVPGLKTLTVVGVENAKQQAQESLNTYVLSLSLS
jgi:hypothetical protein